MEQIIIFFVESIQGILSDLVVHVDFVGVDVSSDFILELIYQPFNLPHRRHQLLIQRILLNLAQLIRQR